MSHRIVRDLMVAREAEGPKAFTSVKRRPRGAKGQGVKFEQALAKCLGPGAVHGQWFEFFDGAGKGYAQTDLLLFAADAVYCLECKLGNIAAGRAQFAELYKPILEHVYRRPAYGIVVARYITEDPEPALVVTSLYDALRAARTRIPTLQWRERFPIVIPPGLSPSLRHPATKAVLSA